MLSAINYQKLHLIQSNCTIMNIQKQVKLHLPSLVCHKVTNLTEIYHDKQPN